MNYRLTPEQAAKLQMMLKKYPVLTNNYLSGISLATQWKLDSKNVSRILFEMYEQVEASAYRELIRYLNEGI